MKNPFAFLTEINSISILIAVLFSIFICVVYRKALKFYITELIKIYSNGDGFFSKKRIESSVGFFGGVGIILCYVWSHRNVLDNWGMLIDAGVLLGIAGYTVKQIQNEKKDDKSPSSDDKK